MLYHILALIGCGMILGWFLASFAESFFHHHIGHASPELRRFWARYPLIGTPFLNAFYEHHIIHHARTFKQDFVTQFTSLEEERDLYLSMPIDRRDFIRDENYGMTLKGSGIVMFVLPIVPLVPIIYLLFGPWVTLGASIPMFVVYPLMSKWLHSIIHKSDDFVARNYSPLEVYIMNTWYMRHVLQDHFLHHEYVMCNSNLVRGGDFWRGYHREPKEKDLRTMKRLGIITPAVIRAFPLDFKKSAQ